MVSERTRSREHDVEEATTTALGAWTRAFDLAGAWNRTATAGLTAWLELQATALETGVELSRRNAHATLAAGQVGVSDNNTIERLALSLDEAFDAIDASTAGSVRALARDIENSLESSRVAVDLQRSAALAMAASLLDVAGEADLTGTEEGPPVRIDLD